MDDPTAREMVGFLLVRGGVHVVAYAKALEKLTGVDVGKLLPIPDISNKKFTEARKHEEKGLHRILYRFSPNETFVTAMRQAGHDGLTTERVFRLALHDVSREFVQAMADVSLHRHMREKRVLLEHSIDGSLERRYLTHFLAMDQDLSIRRQLKPGDHTQGSCLAAA